MATLIRTRKPLTLRDFLWPPGSGSIVRDTLRRILVVVIVTISGALIVSTTMVSAYLVFSGTAVNWLAQILAVTCTAFGQCSNFPAMLASMAAGIMFIALISMAMFSPFFVKPQLEEPESAEMSLATLLLNWYCLSGKSREMLLKLLETSEADVSEGIVHLLREEHQAMQEVMRDGG